MSQNSEISGNKQQLHDSDRELSSEVTLESIHRSMTQNFEKIFETLEFLIHGQALIFGNLLMLSQNDRTVQGEASEQRPENEIQQQQQQHPVELPISPALSSPNESLTSFTFSKPENAVNLNLTGTSPKTCADCGMIFSRKKNHETISNHAKTTTCRPYACFICKQLFKTGSQRNRHQKSHERKRKAENNEEEPDMKRIRNQDTSPLPLKDLASKNNQILGNVDTSAKQPDHDHKSLFAKNAITFTDGSEDEN